MAYTIIVDRGTGNTLFIYHGLFSDLIKRNKFSEVDE